MRADAAIGGLGPLSSATVLCPSLTELLPIYQRDLGLQIQGEERYEGSAAARLRLPGGSPLRACWLGSEHAPRWLRLIEAPWRQGQPATVLRHGWLALELLVGDCEQLVASLAAPWQLLGPPAPLAVSPNIIAAQLLGPSGELYYLTEIRAPVPPFDLPQTTQRVDRPFIAVLACADRERAAQSFIERGCEPGWRFATRISVLSRALQQPLETSFEVAVVPLLGQSLIEIDALSLPAQQSPGPPANPIHLVSMHSRGQAGLWSADPDTEAALVECLDN